MRRPPKYNPGFLDDREIIDLFCVRERELEILVRVLSGNTGSVNQHMMLIGPRGSGKTTLLRRLAAKVREDPALDAVWFPIVLMEENYEILSLRDLWQEALHHSNYTPAVTGSSSERLWKETPNTSDALDEGVEALKKSPGGSKNPYIKDIAFARLLELANRQGKRLLLVCENVSDLLSQLSQKEAWDLRGVLQTDKNLMLIGSSITYFDEIEQPQQAFYNFFKIVELKRMNSDECAKLWHSVSGNALSSSQSQALRILTGGLPRLLIILAWFGKDLSFLELMENLETLIDDHTDYFKSTMETLPAKERKVFASLARIWANAPVGMVATEAGMEQPETSAILNRLVKRGIVEEFVEEGETSPVKRGKTYQLTERLFNIYYLMRRGGAEALFVHDIVNFLIQVFGADASVLLENLSKRDPQSLGERRARFAGMFSRTLEQISAGKSPSTRSSKDRWKGVTYRERQKELEEFRATLKTRRAVDGAEHPDTLQAMHNLALCMWDLGHYEEAEALDRETLELRRRVLGPEHPNTLNSMQGLAVDLSNLGRHEEADALDRETLELCRRVLGPEHPNTLRSMHNLAADLLNLGHYEEAEALDRETLELRRRVLGPEHPDTLWSMYRLAVDLSSLGRHEEAEALNRETLELRRRVLGPEHPDTLRSMLFIFFLQTKTNKHEAALRTLADLLEHPAYIRSCTDFINDSCVKLASMSREIAYQTADIIDKSPSKNTLYPLLAGIRLHLGEKMRLPREVREIAQIIRKKIEKKG